MNIQINAADTLFFRDGKPFAMGDETWANGTFPDMAPGVFLGALRTLYASQKGIDKSDIARITADAKIGEYALCLDNDLAFAIPLDLIGNKKKSNAVNLEKVSNAASSNPFDYILCSSKGYEKADDLSDWRMDNEVLSDYLNGKKSFDYDDLKNINDFVTNEPKIGIGRDRHTNTSREGALYRVAMTRMEGKERQKASFWINIEDLEVKEGDLLRLGAENKVAHFKKTTKSIRVKSPEEWENPALFKLYLSTSAIFKEGIIPDWIDPQNGMRGIIPEIGVEVCLEACAAGRFLSFGGFDIAKYAPKPMMKAVPAGSVYYFRLLNPADADEQIKQIIEYFSINRKPISTIRANEGLGRVFVGKQ